MAEGGKAPTGSSQPTVSWFRNRPSSTIQDTSAIPDQQTAHRSSSPHHSAPRRGRLSRQNEPNAQSLNYVRECRHGRNEECHTEMRTRRAPRPRVHPYKTTVARRPGKFSPIKPSMHGKGLCVVIVNYEDEILGIRQDVQRIGEVYSSFGFTVVGGMSDSSKAQYRNVDDSGLNDILHRINNQYNEDTTIRGAEYDRIFIHFFSFGDENLMRMSDESDLCKIYLLEQITLKLHGLDNTIPCVVFMHSYSEDDTNVATGATRTTYTTPTNFLGCFSVQQNVRGHSTRLHGSWIVQELLKEMESRSGTMTLIQILSEVNKSAHGRHHAPYRTVENGFSILYLTMNQSFVQSN